MLFDFSANQTLAFRSEKMAAIVRVKRRINDDPADYMVLSSKRQRKGSASEASGNNETEEVKNLFKFAGTVQQEVGPCRAIIWVTWRSVLGSSTHPRLIYFLVPSVLSD